MPRFDDCLKFVLSHEGGYVSDSADAGGPTNKGVTQKTYDEWRIARHLVEQDVAQIEDAEVSAIYFERYWLAAKCDQLPEPLDLLHFDSAVNVGVPTANRMLQTALNLGIIDGVIGPRTLAAAAVATPFITIARYCNLRITRYIVVAASRPSNIKFLRGWLRRVGDLLLGL